MAAIVRSLGGDDQTSMGPGRAEQLAATVGLQAAKNEGGVKAGYSLHSPVIKNDINISSLPRPPEGELPNIYILYY